MTEQEMRIAIAEECGYQHMPNAAGLMWNVKENRAVITPGSEVEKARLRMKMPYKAGEHALPDYLHDLNAMHEAEKTVTDIDQYERQLRLVTLRDAEEGIDLCRRLIFATAAQRAEAFLRTIGKWKE